jgi:alpha-glucosidase/alpha-D-xyloside xylohydrolase
MNIGRRQALRRLGALGAGVVLPARVLRVQDSDLVVAGRPVEIVVSTISKWTVRVSVLPRGSSRDALRMDGSLAHANFPVPPEPADLIVRHESSPPAIHIERRNGELVQRLGFSRETGALFFHLGDGPILGMGQGGPQFDRRGSVDEMKSGQGGYRLRTHGGRVPVQWLIGTGGWAMFIHRPPGRFDFTGSEGRFDPAGELLPLDVFVVGSRDPLEIMKEYARLTGYPELPPLWSFGYMQSHRTLAGSSEVFCVARTFREKRLPCDALIYLGTGFTPSGWNAQNGSFAFHRGNFPDPKAAIDELHRNHFRVVLHAVILARDLRGAVGDRCELQRYDEEEVGCYWNVHRRLLDLGIDGFWPDEGDPLDAKARLTRNRMYWEGPQLDRPNERPFALHRNGHAGMQRYASFLWSGDVFTTWETLRTHVSVAIQTGLSGIPYWGTDIGGFVPTKEYTGELHVRWFQFGAFCPLFRSHGRTWHLRLPWGWNLGELGPDELTSASYANGAANPDPSELRNAEVEPILKKYLELRYRLLPYVYTAAREAHDTGLPMIRALWLHHPDDPAAVARGDEYLWGRDLLVAPVTEPGASTRRLYLPRGSWFDFWTQERLEGGREIDRAVDLATLPLFARAGSILPLGPVKQYSDEPVDGPLSIVVYPGRDAAFTLYEDDGKTFDHRAGAWTRIEMEWRDRERRIGLRLAAGSRSLAARRAIEIRVAGETRIRSAAFDGAPIELSI